LRESNEFNKQIIAGAREGIFVMDRDLRVAMWNPWMEQISGLKEDQTLGKKNSELFPFVRETGLDSLMERALAGENIPPLDHIYHIPQTNRRGWASTRYSPLHNTEGEIIGVIAMVTDITERKRAEGVLRENEVRFREMFENMGSGVAIYKVINDGEDFVFTDINPAGARIGQRSREETVGKSVQEVYPGVRDLGLFDVFKRVWRTGRPERHPAEQYQDDRLTIWVENYVCKLPSGEIVAIYEDITEQKKAEREREHLFQEVKSNREQLKSLSHRLVQAQEAERHHLVRKLHDEVGQELTALSLNLNIVRSQLPSTIAAKLTNRIDDSLNLLEKTFERVRDLMAELRPPVLDDYGLTAALHWYGKQFSDRTGISPLLQLKELSPRLPLPVETALLRIAQEALTNVSKYAQAKHIILTLDEVGGEVDLTIADDGVGFDPTVDRQPGSRPAWGLINSRERAQAVGGTLQVKTAPGKGTKIMVKVPINH
jgi:PAS domain S-box-containing protein